MGNIYAQSYKKEDNKSTRKKKLLSLCHLYYEKGAKILAGSDATVEFIGVQIDRLEFQIILFLGMCLKHYSRQVAYLHTILFKISGLHTLPQKYKTIRTALLIASSSTDSFEKLENVDDIQHDLLIMRFKKFELHLQTVLKHWIQCLIFKKCDPDCIGRYKRYYSMSLQTSIKKDDVKQFSQYLRNLLEAIQREENLRG